ncbi:MAG: PAS domain S-box protein, partial [Desulfobacterales bacterium]
MTAYHTGGPQPLMQQNRYMAHIFESIPTGVVALDAEGKIISFNPTAERITGLSADEVLGQGFDGVFQGDYFQNPALHLKNILSTRETTEIKTKVVAANQNNKLHLNIAISPLNSLKDGHIGTVLSLTD